MYLVLRRLVLRFVLCTVVVVVLRQGVLWIGLGSAWIFLLGLYCTLAPVLIDLAAELGWQIRSAALSPLSGKHYAYQTFTLNVWEDVDHFRWISTEDIRRVVGSGATDSILALSYPGGWHSEGKVHHLREDALLLYLAREPSMRAVRFKNWVERNIAFPARKTRERLGVRASDPTQKPEDD